ncbi:protein DpdJ [Ramlibacter montanisoli]|uniref:DEAD/DEAH box helicase n=1 Tax=Ramlibacter montanisoli TaxID=2732512 RepID=A0A849KIW2_9BURK|nr:protein DpdJ [Ramlibacter montanisoli]NNU44775.1 DEAD/DEAH box helicase [Ramlibacter montanisoli]
MTLSADLALVEAALNALEQREVRVLVWGLVDSALGDQEVHDVLNGVFLGDKYVEVRGRADCTVHTAEDLLERLKLLGLIFEVPARGLEAPQRWRTRMAEGLRLLARLRQLMPRHKGPTGWAAAPTLVADYRLLWRPRRYPKRNLGIQDAEQSLASSVQSEETLHAVRHWLGKASPGWQLSRFQLDAASRILGALDQQYVSATLVSAGTGSGKTLAFYLPALSWLAAQKLTHPRSGGVRILAIYPRNELLKDQLSEVYSQARKFDDLLGNRGGRPISVGVLYGDTPNTLASIKYAWNDHQGACPFFKCPAPGCNSSMGVVPQDLEGKLQRLTCVKCGHQVDRTTLHLTRQSMQEQPPDILFTSVEMLNQRMADSDMRHLFGLGPDAERTPSLVLLDEVHVYSGTYGAQVAHLLRRWSRLSGRRASFVGLSATISEGERFFASLVGLNETAVSEITPSPDDMDSEGAEYMVALRGDPVSQAALLSTSIQTLMLGSRLLDTRGQFDRASRPFAGWRAFAFTDQMDATNRLYADLLDAEGRTAQGREATRRHPDGGLAHLRQPDLVNSGRYEAGQDWRLPVQIGHDLRKRHQVGRTTAYDSGVADHTEIVVATAALEVGYDDEAVGMVLQHKAPRDMAQFLQRKGRAGRTRHMRPWTIMVLSDYGRDRQAYQAYEQFFDPELPPRDLPMGNRYVQRMQAVYALLDYLGVQMQAGLPRGSVWQDLSGPPETHRRLTPAMKQALMGLVRTNDFPLTPERFGKLESDAWRIVSSLQDGLAVHAARRGVAFHVRRKRMERLLHSLLTRPDDAESLAQHLMAALDLPRQSVDALLWEHPRPLLLEAAPTALRRLERNWEANGQPQTDYRTNHPLPEFVPGTLFSDLSLPEVRIDRPQAERESYLPVQQALGEMAPGKVSKRYDHALWLGVDEARLLQAVQDSDLEPTLDVEVSDWYDLEPHQGFHVEHGRQVEQLPAFRPRVLKLQPTPDDGNPNFPLVKATSNARLVWSSQVFARREGHPFPRRTVGWGSPPSFPGCVLIPMPPSRRPACDVMQWGLSPACAWGLSCGRGGHGESTVDQRIDFRFTYRGRPCGVGFEIDVDALRFELDLPLSPHLAVDLDHAPTLRGLRTARYFCEARDGQGLEALEPNVFLRHWMAEIFLTAIMQRCTQDGDDLRTALDWVAASPQNLALEPILETLFQAPAPSDDEGGDDDDEGRGANGQAKDPDRLRDKLRRGLARTDVIASLRAIGEHLLEPVDASWDAWLTRVMKHTLAAALVEAIQTSCPQVDGDDLAVDVDAGPNESGEIEPGHRIWITEINPGGNGLIEQVIETLATDPVGFYQQVEAALGMSEFEVIDQQLRNFIGRIGGETPDHDLLGRVQAVRHSQNTQQAQEAIAALRFQLVQTGHSVFHGYVAAIANRVLRPGTPDGLDRILAQLLETWTQLEERLEVEVDARVICAIFSQDQRIDAVFAGAGLEPPPTSQRQVWRFSMLMGVIWARGHALRANALPLQQRYDLVPAVTERLVLSRWLTPPDEPVPAAEDNWLGQVHARLRERGRASVALPHDREVLSQVMQALTTQPVQMEYLNVYPRLLSVARTVGSIVLRLELVETL